MTIIVVSLLSLLPMGRLLVEVVFPAQGTALEAMSRVFPRLRPGGNLEFDLCRDFWNPFAVVLGTSVALLVSLTDIRGRAIFIFLYVTPLLIAPQVTALAGCNCLVRQVPSSK